MIKARKQSQAPSTRVRFQALCVVMLALWISRGQAGPTAAHAKSRIFAQTLVEDTVAKHPELLGLELATTPPRGNDCITVAATDAKEVGDKCDREDLSVLNTGNPTVERESDGYDVTLPLHVRGKVIGIIGMDFRLDQKESGLIDRANVIATELEDQIPGKSKLFEVAR